jgi:hypothetical protein
MSVNLHGQPYYVMKVEVFSLCDFASADVVGKMNIIGIFDTVFAKETPATHSFCARFDKVEEGLKKIKISFIDSDGKLIMPAIEAQIQVQAAPNGLHANVQVVSLIQQIKLPNFGEYSIDLAIDGRQEASTPLYVRQLPILPPHLQTPPQVA